MKEKETIERRKEENEEKRMDIAAGVSRPQSREPPGRNGEFCNEAGRREGDEAPTKTRNK